MVMTPQQKKHFTAFVWVSLFLFLLLSFPLFLSFPPVFIIFALVSEPKKNVHASDRPIISVRLVSLHSFGICASMPSPSIQAPVCIDSMIGWRWTHGPSCLWIPILLSHSYAFRLWLSAFISFLPCSPFIFPPSCFVPFPLRFWWSHYRDSYGAVSGRSSRKYVCNPFLVIFLFFTSLRASSSSNLYLGPLYLFFLIHFLFCCVICISFLSALFLIL